MVGGPIADAGLFVRESDHVRQIQSGASGATAFWRLEAHRYPSEMADNVSVWRSEWGNIRALESQLDEQRAEADANQRRLASQLHKLQGDLSERVNRLSASFDAFVELSEIRDQLGLYVDARRWRLAARQLVESSLSRVPAPADGGSDTLADVPGYWLPGAVRALPDVLERRSAPPDPASPAEPAGPVDPADLVEALRRDRLRTSTFIVCVAALLGSPSIADEHVAAAFAGDDAHLTAAQAAIWRAAADGALSRSARSTIDEAFARRLAALDAGARDAVVARLAQRPPGVPRSAPPSGASDQLAAAADLQRWSAWLTADRPVEGSKATPSRGSTDGVGGRLLSVVRSLVEEGSPPEQVMLDRADSLRVVIDPGQPAPPAGWDDDAGAIGDLLADDLLADAPMGDADRGRSTARDSARLLADCIADASDVLLVRAAAPGPSSTVVRHAGRSLTVTPSGADPGELAAIEARMNVPAGTSTVDPRKIAAGWAVAIVVFVVLGIAVSPGWFVLAALAGGGAALWGFAVQRATTSAVGEQLVASEELHRRIGQAAQQLVDDAGRAQVAHAEATNAHAAIRAALGR